jgi:N4-bis(aminopropyl)spermidine synthase
MMREDTVQPLISRVSPAATVAARPEALLMDLDAVIADVAAAVGLAEGESGVRDVLRAVAGREPVAVREVSRSAELPVPIVAAVCNELRKRGALDPGRPVRLSPASRELLAPVAPGVTGRCGVCGGSGLAIPADLAGLQDELTAAAAGAPAARPELDQTHCTVATKIHRVLRMHEAGALFGQRIIVLGDDDLGSVAIAKFAALAGAAAGIRRLAVVDTDRDVLAWAAEQVAGTGVAAEFIEHDLREPLPAGLAGGFEVACTDPPYTVAGAELFLSRAVAALVPEPGQHIFFSFGARRPDETVRTQGLMTTMGLAIRSLSPGFNTYLGAGILAGTSHLYHLRSTAASRSALDGAYGGPLYTADGRAATVRPYRCPGCRAVHEVGPGSRWPRIASLQAAGCPECGGTTFRPMALQSR